MPVWNSDLGCFIPMDEEARKEALAGEGFIGLDPTTAAEQSLKKRQTVDERNPYKKAMDIEDQKKFVFDIQERIMKQVRDARKIALEEQKVRDKKAKEFGEAYMKRKMMAEGIQAATREGL